MRKWNRAIVRGIVEISALTMLLADGGAGEAAAAESVKGAGEATAVDAAGADVAADAAGTGIADAVGTGAADAVAGSGLSAAAGSGLGLAAETGTGAGLSASAAGGLGAGLATETGTGLGLAEGVAGTAAAGAGADILGGGLGSALSDALPAATAAGLDAAGAGLTAAPGAGTTLAAPTASGSGLTAAAGPGTTLAAPTGTGAGLEVAGTDAGALGGAAGAAPSTVDRALQALKAAGNSKWAGPAISTGIDGLRANQEASAQRQLQGVAAQTKATSDALLAKFNSGQLTPADQVGIANWAQSAKAQVRQYYQKAGLGNSAMAVQAEAQIDQQADAMRSSALSNELNNGLKAAGVSDPTLVASIKAGLQEDQDATKTMGDFFQQLAKIGG